jgi:hypothetical protein
MYFDRLKKYFIARVKKTKEDPKKKNQKRNSVDQSWSLLLLKLVGHQKRHSINFVFSFSTAICFI